MTDDWSGEDKRGTNPATDHNCGCDHLGCDCRDSDHLIVVATRQVAVAMTLMSRSDEARRIAANIAKLPQPLGRRQSGVPGMSARAMPPRMKAAAGRMRMRRATNSRASTTAISRRMSSKREMVVTDRLTTFGEEILHESS